LRLCETPDQAHALANVTGSATAIAMPTVAFKKCRRNARVVALLSEALMKTLHRRLQRVKETRVDRLCRGWAILIR